MRGVPFV